MVEKSRECGGRSVKEGVSEVSKRRRVSGDLKRSVCWPRGCSSSHL